MRSRIKYHIIYRHGGEYPVSVMRAFFAVSSSGYYVFDQRLGRSEKDAALAELIAQRRERSFHTYCGCPPNRADSISSVSAEANGGSLA